MTPLFRIVVFPYFYSFILCKYTLLTTTKLALFLCTRKFQGKKMSQCHSLTRLLIDSQFNSQFFLHQTLKYIG